MGNSAVIRTGIAIMLAMIGCAPKPEMSGSALPLNMQPSPPRFVGAYDFDLLDAVQGRSCVTRPSLGDQASIYWFAGAGLEKLSPDALTEHSIGAAAFEALKNSPDADSIVVTRVVAEGHGPDKVCTTVYGRAIRLKKARKASVPDHEDGDDLARPGK